MRKLVSLLLGCLMVSLLTGCTLPQKDYCDSVSQSVEKCFEDVNSFPAVFSDSVFSVKYDKLSPEEQKLIACYVKCCSVDSVTQDETSMTVCVSVPSVKSLQSHFSFDDSSFSNEYKKLQLKKVSSGELQSFAYDFVSSLLLSDSYESESFKFQVQYSKETGMLSSDSDLALKLFSVLTPDYLQGISKQEKKKETVKNTVEFSEINSDEAFVCRYKKHSILVSNISVLEGSAAMDAVHKLSIMNGSFGVDTNSTCYFLKYSVTDLSPKGSLIFENPIRLVSNGVFLNNSGYKVFGLQDVQEIKNGGSVEITCFLVGPPDAKICWSSENCSIGLFIQPSSTGE